MPGCTLILSRADDPHALAVQDALLRAGRRAEIAASDRLAWDGALSWESRSGAARIRCVSGAELALSDVDVLWWRRSNRQRAIGAANGEDALAPIDAEVVNRSCASAWLGALNARPPRRVVDDPWMVVRAENKIVQLAAAARVGLVAPPTLVSNDPAAIRAFARDHRWLVAKTLRHAPGAALATIPVSDEMLEDSEALSACPAIYQALVPGEEHLRLLMFGDTALGARLRSGRLDWRGEGAPEMASWQADAALVRGMRALLDALGLSMGVFDFKLDGDTPVFLEVNPQGQFLSVAALAEPGWADQFASFLAG